MDNEANAEPRANQATVGTEQLTGRNAKSTGIHGLLDAKIFEAKNRLDSLLTLKKNIPAEPHFSFDWALRRVLENY